tara:strand:+ start:1390 stop:1875 length:486 start_codon:yes stop_codon:yes gene_type:complete
MEDILRARTLALPSLSVVRRTVDSEEYRRILARELQAHRPLYEMLISRPSELYETVTSPPASVPWEAVQAGECGADELERTVRMMREFAHPLLRTEHDRELYRTVTSRMLGYKYEPAATLTLADAVKRAREEAGDVNAPVRGALLTRARELIHESQRHRRA